MTPNRAMLAGILCVLASLATLAYLIRTPFEMTRLRNALIAEVGVAEDFVWQPDAPPPGYAVESRATPTAFREVAAAEEFDDANDAEFERALEIARHMTGGDRGPGNPIKSDTESAYRAIVTQNRGYCSDFTQVFNALGLASGVPVREWGMSFDGFSGEGHAFSEVYDHRIGKWVFIDPFFSFYVVDERTGLPLSVLEFRERLAANDESLVASVVAIDPGAFGFKYVEKAIEYYAAGVDELYLWFGNDVFSYDANDWVRAASGLGRAAEQAVGILVGAHPRIRIYPDPEGANSARKLAHIRTLFLVAFVLGLFGCLSLGYGVIGRQRAAARRVRG